MKKLLLASVFALGVLAWSAAAAEMTGVITCNKCRHTDLSAQSAKCAEQCIKGGVATVFIDTANDNKVYTIANPDKVQGHIGQKVTVNGDVENDKLTVESVKKA